MAEKRGPYKRCRLRKRCGEVPSSEHPWLVGTKGNKKHGVRRDGNKKPEASNSQAAARRRGLRGPMSYYTESFWSCSYCGLDMDEAPSSKKYHEICKKRKEKGIPPPYSGKTSSSSSSSSGSQSGPGNSGGNLAESSDGKVGMETSMSLLSAVRTSYEVILAGRRHNFRPKEV